MGRVPFRGRGRPSALQLQHQAEQFRTARLMQSLTVKACAQLLRVSVRTIANWESARSEIPYSAYKLMRVLRGRKLLGPAWSGFQILGDVLVTPEGRELRSVDLAWWSFLVLQAQEFRNERARRRDGPPVLVATAMAYHCQAPNWIVKAPVSTRCLQGVDTSGTFSPAGPVNKSSVVLDRRMTFVAAAGRPPVGPSSNTGQKSERSHA
ncbi:VC1465 family Xer recombination activation factor [Xanthomonas populi]|nr:VC1465 family Xer recombination activation factor [Xanthomonas populi]